MKKFLNNRVLPVVCALSILISLCVVPVSAVWDSSRDVADIDEVAHWEGLLSTPAHLSLFCVFWGLPVSATVSDVFWNFVDNVVLGSPVGEVGIDDLESICSQYNNYFNRPLSSSFAGQIISGTQEIASDILAFAFFNKLSLTFEVRSRGTSGMKRIYCPELDAWVVSSSGRYAYVNEAHLDTSGGNHWIPKSSAETNLTKSEVLTGSQMKQICTQLQLAGVPAYVGNFASKYKAIYRDGREVYANPDGYPFVSAADDAEWAVNQSRPDTSVKDEDGNQVEDLPEDNVTNIDLSGMTITLPDGSINFIDKLIYDESTKSYHIDSHDTYNYTTYNYYTWNYYVNYTSITYIGQTEEYNKYYEVYYELPDGRDSADLTKEEVEQLNVSVDVIPYGRSADDTSLRSLYHFDGDTRDSSYWNYCTDFTWNTGASLTYMDAGVFEGALYLDETDHDWTLTLPSEIGDQDFTLQFRYYQSYTAAPQTDSYIRIGLYDILHMDGGWLKDSQDTQLTAIPVGTWNEIAIIRNDGTLYFYLNGLCVGSYADSSYMNNKIDFHFGSSQQTYKYFDELRVLNYALQTGGDSYTPTSVPHDTNLTLVLPDSALPVADEYWDIQFSDEAELNIDFTNNGSSSKFAGSDTSSTSLQTGKDGIALMFSDVSSNNRTEYAKYPAATTIGGIRLLKFSLALGSLVPSKEDYNYVPVSFTVLFGDGSQYTLNYSYRNDTNPKNYDESGNLVGTGRCQIISVPNGYLTAQAGIIYFIMNPNISGTVIRAMSVHVGDSVGSLSSVTFADTSIDCEKITSITPMTPDQMKTPTLAVRTDLDITSHQIGGVRPSVPTKGQVWAMVENERITSIQIYNGQAWEGVDGRIWTGERWVPASSYNIITLQDMYDIVDSTPNYEYIYSEAGFWSWWQKSWNAFVERLFIALGAGGVGASGASGGVGSSELNNVDLDAEDVVSNPDEEDGKTFWQFIVLVIAGGKSVVSGVRHMFSGVVSSVPGSMESVTDAFNSGGVAVGFMDGTASDPDAVDMPAVLNEDNEESEVLDPWRYR